MIKAYDEKFILCKNICTYIVRQFKYVYYHNLKCATRTIIEFLSYHSTVNHSEKYNLNKQLAYDSEWDDYFKFSFVRNPYDRLFHALWIRQRK